MQDPEIEIKDRRQFERWNTSIPCKVLWGEWIISGESRIFPTKGP